VESIRLSKDHQHEFFGRDRLIDPINSSGSMKKSNLTLTVLFVKRILVAWYKIPPLTVLLNCPRDRMSKFQLTRTDLQFSVRVCGNQDQSLGTLPIHEKRARIVASEIFTFSAMIDNEIHEVSFRMA
jgi:hypothetical protein